MCAVEEEREERGELRRDKNKCCKRARGKEKEKREEQTDLEERLDTLAIQIGYLGMAAGFIVFEIEVIRTLNKIGYGDDLPLSNLLY